MLRAYLDANAVNHIYDRDPAFGVDDAVADKIIAAAKAASLVISGSDLVAEELVRTARSDRTRAAGFGALYWELMAHDHLVADPIALLEGSARAYAHDEPAPSPVKGPPSRTWRAFAELRVPDEFIDGIVSAALSEVTRDQSRMKILAPQGRAAAAALRSAGEVGTSRAEAWRAWAPRYLEGWARRAGVLEECRRRGLDGLLRLPCFRAVVGFEVEQLYAQTFDCEPLSRGDRYDFRHLVSAAAIGAVFVTDDARLRKRANLIPDPPVDAISVAELAARL